MTNEDDTLPCADKMTFDSQAEAAATAVVADWQHGTSLKAYRCTHCGLWHLSSSHG